MDYNVPLFTLKTFLQTIALARSENSKPKQDDDETIETKDDEDDDGIGGINVVVEPKPA